MMRSLVRRPVLAAARAALGLVLATRPGLRAVNRLHAALSPGQKRRFFHRFMAPGYRLEGRWAVDFAGRRILLPLHRDFALAWCAAVAFHGYDPEIHAFYEWLVQGPRRPRAVLDVGGSYGAHSLRFLAHGIRTLTVEPNPACHAYFRECCALNGLRPELHAVALGEATGRAELAFPRDATYLGTTAARARARWGARPDVETLEVPVVTLDELVEREGVTPDLIKIDTEGGELGVLRGAGRTLARARPLVLFESWTGDPDRPSLFDLLAGAGYAVQAPAPPFLQGPELARPAFLASPGTNFLARPRD